MTPNLSALSTTQLESIAIARHGPDAKLIAASFSKRGITRQGWMKAAMMDPADCERVRDERWQAALRGQPRWIP
jgi:hypothetical protein